jgi:hypothetical protein
MKIDFDNNKLNCNMKKVMIILAMACFAGTVFAQKDPVSAAFEKYDGKEGFTVVTLTGDMLNMFTKAAEEKHDTTFKSKITSLRILVREKEKAGASPVPDFKTEVYDKLDKQAYKEMMTVKQSDQNVVILVKENGGRISELLLMVTGQDDNVLIQAKGDMLLSEMADLGGKCQINGMDQLKKLEKAK